MSKECKTLKKQFKKRKSLCEMFIGGEELVMKRITTAGKSLKFSKRSDSFGMLLDHAYASVFQINQFYKRTVEIITEHLYGKKVPKDQTPEKAVEKIIKEEFENAKKALELEMNKYIANEEFNEEIDEETETLKEKAS